MKTNCESRSSGKERKNYAEHNSIHVDRGEIFSDVGDEGKIFLNFGGKRRIGKKIV